MLCEGPRKDRCRSLQFLEFLRHAVLGTTTISAPRPDAVDITTLIFASLVCRFRLTFMIPSFCYEKPCLVNLKTVLSNFHTSFTLHMTDYVQIMCRLCVVYVQIMCRLCVDYVQFMCRLCVVYVQIMCSLCVDYVQIMCSLCIVYVQFMCRLCVDYVQFMCRLCVDYVQFMCELCVDYVQIMCSLCVDYVQIMCRRHHKSKYQFRNGHSVGFCCVSVKVRLRRGHEGIGAE